MLDLPEILTHDVQVGARQQVMDFGYTAGLRIFDGYHAQSGLAGSHSFEYIFKRRARQGLHIWAGLAAGQIGICPFHAHESNGIFRVNNVITGGSTGHKAQLILNR